MVTISDSAVKKIKSIIHEEDPSLKLRVFVQGGGCSGFQYGFSLEELPPSEDDLTFEKDGIELKPTALNFSWASLESEKCEQIAFCVSQIMFSSLPNLLNIEDLPLPLAPTIKPIP